MIEEMEASNHNAKKRGYRGKDLHGFSGMMQECRGLSGGQPDGAEGRPIHRFEGFIVIAPSIRLRTALGSVATSGRRRAGISQAVFAVEVELKARNFNPFQL